MSDSPVEEGSKSAAKGKKGNYVKETISSLTSMDINRALKQLRWLNLIIGLVIIVVQFVLIFGSLVTFKLGTLLLQVFCILYAGILCLYEMQFKKLGRKLRGSYGFLYTYIGRALYLVFLSTIVLSTSGLFNYILGGLMFIVGLYNVLIIFIHPAFKKGGLHVYDDPTAGYTAGESELTDMMKKNPQLAQKMLIGASKLASS